MTRAVFDPNVLIAAALSPDGAPADCLRARADGRFDLIVNERLLGELAEVLARDKFRRYLSPDQAERLVAALRRDALLCVDPRTQLGDELGPAVHLVRWRRRMPRGDV